jgi:hypothetical protein
MGVRFSSRLVAILSLAAFVALPTLASARRGANAAEKRHITAAVKHSSTTSSVPDSHYDVKRIRMATVAHGWARAELVPRPKYRASAQGATALLRKTNGRWRVRNLGTAGLGCNIPRAVATDLRLDC